MSFRNLDYLYEHLPARCRRDDADLFLKRFLSFFGGELDDFDQKLDDFYQLINPTTATEDFTDWWLWSLFGWSYFPVWFTLPRKRAFYAQIARLYARRGTKPGIEELLAAFGITARVTTEPRFWGEEDATWGAGGWMINGPLGFVVEIYPVAAALNEDVSVWGETESTWGEDFWATPAATLGRVDVDALLRFEQPLAQVIMIEEKSFQ
ncbi:MAG: hypothetical protein DMF64_18845 [Acidobacteria bacterium]|nr:MAG: hypothetical protein DMF64_18845 [Acidobacteriota bacterium]